MDLKLKQTDFELLCHSQQKYFLSPQQSSSPGLSFL